MHLLASSALVLSAFAPALTVSPPAAAASASVPTSPAGPSATASSTADPELQGLDRDPKQRLSQDPKQDLKQDLKQEYEKRRAAAEGDKDALWELVDWCEANSMAREKRSVLRAIVDLDDGDVKAHEMLGHVRYDGRWFTSERKLEAYKKEKEEREAKEKGLVRYGDGWAHPDDVPFLEKGLVKTPDGTWVDPEELRRIEEGWRRQDLTWVSPDEFDQLEQGLWKCGDQWLPLEEANAYHAELGRWWTIPGNYFHLWTTLPREVAMEALGEVERTFRDLTRIYGVVPTEPMPVVVVNGLEQYGRFAGGSEGAGTDALGLSSVHGAFFADLFFDPATREWTGLGAGYWDPTTEEGSRFGRTYARHAAGLSFGEAVDPSPEMLEAMAKAREPRFDPEAFYGEKDVPRWFRIGAATYVERYFVDSFVGPGGDPHWARTWSVNNILRRGGLDPLDTIFSMPISPDNPDSDKLINEAGLLVAFVVDGENPAVQRAHAAVKAALRSAQGGDAGDGSGRSGDGPDVRDAFEALEKAIADNEDALRAFADL